MNECKNLKILFLDILTDDENLRKTIHEKVYERKTYSDDMRRTFGLSRKQWTYADGSKGIFPRAPFSFDAVVIGGSMEDPVSGNEKKWVKKTYPFIRQVVKQKIPILGICGGLQFTVRALNGKVIYNPNGREFGNTKITIKNYGKKDPIFRGLGARAVVLSSHKCMAINLKPGWKLLASSGKCATQAIAIGNHIRLFQFHPEMKPKQIYGIAKLKKTALMSEGFFENSQDFNAFIKSVKDTSYVGNKIIKNFLLYFVLPNAHAVLKHPS